MSNVFSTTGAGDQQPSTPTKQRKSRGGKKFDKGDKGASSDAAAAAAASSAQVQGPPTDKEMCALEMWLECSSDHLEGPNCSMDKPLALAGLRSVKNVRPLVGKLSEVKQLLDTCFQAHAEGCVLPRSALLRLRRIVQLAACRSYRCIVAGTRFECPFDPPLVCGILDHWIAELQPHSNKRDPVLSRHYSMNGRPPWQRPLAELLSAKSLPQSLDVFCDLEHVHDSVMFNTQRASFKDTCDRMLAKLKPVPESCDRQQELAAWMEEGLKEFASRHSFAYVGSCASGLHSSDSDLNVLMQPHDTQLLERKDGLDFLHNFSKHLKKRAKPAHFSNVMAYSCHTPYALCSRITCKISGAAGVTADVDCTIIVGDQSHVARCTLLKLYSDFDPRLQQLVALVKAWAFSRFVSIDVRWKNSYAWTLMAISFLQFGVSPPVLPCIHALLSPSLLAALSDNPQQEELAAVLARERAALLSKHGRNELDVAELALSFFHYFSCVFDFETWALSVQNGQPVLKSSISGASFPPTSVVVLDPVDGDRNAFGSFVVETADAMRVELYRVFQIARHTSRILPVREEASDESAAAAPSSSCSIPEPFTDISTDDVATVAVAVPVLPSKAPAAAAAAAPVPATGGFSKYSPNSIPANVLAELQDVMGLRLGAAVATIKRNAQGVVTGYRECKGAKAGCSLVRRYEVQVRLSLDNSSVFLYPDQLNVVHLKQAQQPQVAVQLRPTAVEKEARTLDSSVVNAAVQNIAAVVSREGGSCTLMQLHKASASFRGGPSAFSHDDDSRAALDALELLLRAHAHVFTLRPSFDRGDFQVQLVSSTGQPNRSGSGSGSVAPFLNPAAPNFNASASSLSASVGSSQPHHQLIPPSSRAHLWHEMSGKVVQQQQHQQQHQQQQDRWN